MSSTDWRYFEVCLFVAVKGERKCVYKGLWKSLNVHLMLQTHTELHLERNTWPEEVGSKWFPVKRTFDYTVSLTASVCLQLFLYTKRVAYL